MIDFESGVPVHRQVTDSLRERIRRGDWPAGSYLPREADLASEYGVGVDTIRKVFSHLRTEGVIRRGGPGKRSRVPPAAPKEVARVPRGSVCEVWIPSEQERAHFGVPEGVALIRVTFGVTETLYRSDRHTFHFS